jgi:hypothetical protein
VFKGSRFWKVVLPATKLLVGVGLSLLLIAASVELFLGYRQSIWDGSSQVTFVYENNGEIGYVAINPQLGEVVVLLMPENAQIELAYGYGSYLTSKVHDLADLEGVWVGKLLQKSMSHFLGRATDSYITGLEVKRFDLPTFFQKSLFGLTNSGFGSWDNLRLLLHTTTYGPEQIKIVNLADTSAFAIDKLPDGTEVYIPIFEELDNLVLKFLADPANLKETSTWEIFNGTQHNGLAFQVSRMVANTGFDVVGARQALEMHEKSVIEVSQGYESQEITNFANYLHVPVRIHQDKSRRAQVTFIVGEDYWNECCTREALVEGK